jgi:hypothetical protein
MKHIKSVTVARAEADDNVWADIKAFFEELLADIQAALGK